MHVYSLTIAYNEDKPLKYKFTNVIAHNQDEAIAKMKEYVATHGLFPNKAHDEIISNLVVLEIGEMDLNVD